MGSTERGRTVRVGISCVVIVIGALFLIPVGLAQAAVLPNIPIVCPTDTIYSTGYVDHLATTGSSVSLVVEMHKAQQLGGYPRWHCVDVTHWIKVYTYTGSQPLNPYWYELPSDDTHLKITIPSFTSIMSEGTWSPASGYGFTVTKIAGGRGSPSITWDGNACFAVSCQYAMGLTDMESNHYSSGFGQQLTVTVNLTDFYPYTTSNSASVSITS